MPGQRTGIPSRDRRRQLVRSLDCDTQRGCLAGIEVTDVAGDQHARVTIRGRREHVAIPGVGELQGRRNRLRLSDNGITDQPDVLLERSGSMRTLGRKEAPTRFLYNEIGPDRSKLTRLRRTEEEPRHRRLEEHGRVEEHNFHTHTPVEHHVDVP